MHDLSHSISAVTLRYVALGPRVSRTYCTCVANVPPYLYIASKPRCESMLGHLQGMRAIYSSTIESLTERQEFGSRLQRRTYRECQSLCFAFPAPRLGESTPTSE
mmetsp:Transcript_19387/g.57659  ORF Transcript_19387/g.57659 Transcript_19387/m.57659 type:complete len:105 (+) Transcript_19387:3330-3644(+)